MNGTRTRTMFAMNKRLAFLFLLLAGAVLAGCSAIGLPGKEPDPAPVDDGVQKIDYEVTITGVDSQEKALLDSLEENSTAKRLRDRPPATLAGLERRAEDDVKRFGAVLRSYGFYDGKVSFDLRAAPGDRQDGGTAADASTTDRGLTAPPPESAVVDYRIETGPPYLLAETALRIIRPEGTEQQQPNEEELRRIGLSSGMRAEAAAIIQAEQRAVEAYRNKGYPLARAGERRVTADTAAKTLNVTYAIVTGEKARFGKITVIGAKEVDPDFIAGYRSWQPHEVFSAQELATTRRDLAQSNLFTAAGVSVADQVNDQGEIPVEIRVEERDHRTISGGVYYSSAEGPGANAQWEHRNLLGAGERLRLGIDVSSLLQGVEADFKKPQFLRRRQALIGDFQAGSNQTDAYDGELVESFVGIERQFFTYWSATAGISAEYSNLTGAESSNDNYYLGGLRGLLRRDSTSDPLDPTSGSRLELTLTPYTSLGGATTRFISTSLAGSHYIRFDQAARHVLAWRARVGSIWGEELPSLPSNKRFYAGGGGSVRGYAYQKVGPLDENDDPTGGRSLLTAGVEVRNRIAKNFGVVPFIEGGNVFDDSWPENLTMQWAAGLGLRYYTAIGPLRFDFAVPLDKRAGIDDDFQIYISIGQAF